MRKLILPLLVFLGGCAPTYYGPPRPVAIYRPTVYRPGVYRPGIYVSPPRVIVRQGYWR